MKRIFLLLLIFSPVAGVPYEIDFDFQGARPVEKQGGREVFKKPDGTMIMKYPERDEALLKDLTKIIKYHTGKREIHTSDGITIHIDFDGTTRYVYPNGREKTISMDGKTPYGLKIDDQKEVIRKRNSSVEILYSSALSDEIATPPMMKYYKALIRETEKAMQRSVKVGETVKIVISHCRFCSTGYCRRKNRKEIAVTAIRDGVPKREIFLIYEDMLGKDAHIELAKRTAAEIFR